MGFVNPLHIAFVAVVALLVLGPKRFPEVARSVGNGYREFREQLSAVTQQAHTELTAPAPGNSTVENAAVVEQISPDREVTLTSPVAETTTTGPTVLAASELRGLVATPPPAEEQPAPSASAS